MPCMNNLPLALGISYMAFLKPGEKRVLSGNIASLKELVQLTIKDISKIVRREIKSSAWFPERLEKQVEYALKIMQAYNIKTCLLDDRDYPLLLKEIFDPPFMLFWRGNIGCLAEKTAAVVGTRRASAQGLKAAFEISKNLAENGVTVVSGLAHGIDGAAHKGAVSAKTAKPDSGASTCAVLACGVENIYPEGHKRLSRVMLEKGGCILSEYPPAWSTQKWCFPARNRIISGLSSITAVIEAPAGSGALITADFAIEQGRELVFHECCTGQPKQELTQTKKMDINQYINDGAPVISSADEILAVIQH